MFASFGLPLFASPTPSIVLPSAIPSPAWEPPDTGNEVKVDISPGTVQSVIAALDRLERYSRQVTTTLNGTEFHTRVDVDNGWTRAVTDGPNPTHTIVGNGQVWRWYQSGTGVAVWPADHSSADLDAQRLPTYEDVLSLDPTTITDAGYRNKNGCPCVYVEVNFAELDQRERYWISAGDGLLFAAEIETGGSIVYSMTASAPEALSAASDELFCLPDGTLLHTASSAPAGTVPESENEH